MRLDFTGRLLALAALAFVAAVPVQAQKATQQPTTEAPAEPPALPPAADASGIVYGDDLGRYPNDGECDDRRFTGAGMAIALAWETTGHDATDCRALVEQGRITLWSLPDAMAATQCEAIDFGTDASEFANDTECDDLRFEGMGMASIVNNLSIGSDASDCRAYCQYGTIALRNY